MDEAGVEDLLGKRPDQFVCGLRNKQMSGQVLVPADIISCYTHVSQAQSPTL